MCEHAEKVREVLLLTGTHNTCKANGDGHQEILPVDVGRYVLPLRRGRGAKRNTGCVWDSARFIPTKLS